MITTVTLNASVDKLYLVDSLEPNTVMRVREVSNTAGGKGLNVAKVAALAGETVRALGFLGGYNGQYVRALLQARGIADGFTEVGSETRCCINIRDLSAGTHTEFLEPGAPVTETELNCFLDSYQDALKDSAVVAISGSVPKGTPATFYRKLVEYAHDASCPVILDTSGRLLETSLSACPTLIKPNQDEIAQLLGRAAATDIELLEAAKHLHHSGIAYVAVSLGKEGSLFVCDEGVFSARPPEISIVNTVGCGDSMVAGFAVGIARGWNAAEMLRFATAISAANALCTQTGYFEQSDLDSLADRIAVAKIS